MTALSAHMNKVSNLQGAHMAAAKAALQQVSNAAAHPTPNIDAVSALIACLSQVKVIEVADMVSDALTKMTNTRLRETILARMIDIPNQPNSSLNEQIADQLALAKIAETIGSQRALELNAGAYFHLGAGQNNKLDKIFDTFESLQPYYLGVTPDAEDGFALSESQLKDLDAILIKTVKDMLKSGKHTPELADRAADLLDGIESIEVAESLKAQLFDVRSPEGKEAYLEALLCEVALTKVPGKDVKHPILSRYGSTYAEVFRAIGPSNGDISAVVKAGQAGITDYAIA